MEKYLLRNNMNQCTCTCHNLPTDATGRMNATCNFCCRGVTNFPYVDPQIKTVFEKEETLRDKFAMHTLNSLLSKITMNNTSFIDEDFAIEVYRIADIFMKVRDNKN